MSFQWGGRTWNSDDLGEFIAYLNSKGVDYDTWAGNHPTAAASFYNPYAYVPGQGRTDSPVPEAIQDKGYADMGNLPPDEYYSPPPDENPVPAPPPEENLGGGYDPAKAASAAGKQTEPPPGYTPPSYPEPGQGGLDQAPSYTPGTPTGAPPPATTAPPGNAALDDLYKQYPLDWSNLLGTYKIDQSVVDELNRIFSITGGDLNKAIPIAQAYVRGTQWYRDNYPSIQDGINAGLFDDERGYRVYQNQVNQIYQQYYGRFATPSEAADYMRQGKSIEQVGRQFQSQALIGTLNDPLKRLFTDEELVAYMNETAGIDTALGQEITKKAEMAMKVNYLYRDFMGREINRTELDALIKDGTQPDQIARNFAMQSNIAAMNPAIRDLFTAKEIQDMALSAVGGITKDGELLGAKAQLAAQLNAAYHTFTGQGVTREEVESAWGQGLTADEVSKRLEASQIQGSLPQYLRDIFDETTLRGAAAATSGADLSAAALRSQQLVNGAGAYQQVVRQYENRNVTQQELNNYFDQDISAERLGKQYQAKGIAATKGTSYQNVLGSFGGEYGGQLGEDEMLALSQEQAGIDTILGQQLQERLTKAQKRVAGAFNSAVSKPSLSFVGGRLTTSRGRTPDVGA